MKNVTILKSLAIFTVAFGFGHMVGWVKTAWDDRQAKLTHVEWPIKFYKELDGESYSFGLRGDGVVVWKEMPSLKKTK